MSRLPKLSNWVGKVLLTEVGKTLRLGNVARGIDPDDAINRLQYDEAVDRITDLEDGVVAPTTNTINSGGELTINGVNLLQMDVAAVNYTISGIVYDEVSTSSVILNDGDATYARIDAVVLTTSGVEKITGTASATPVSPTIPSNNILLSYIDVPAGATSITGGTILVATLYVSMNGNDSTAQRGSTTRKYRTVARAKLFAQSGDVIYVEPGTYSFSATLAKNGITYKIDNAILTNTTTANSLGDGGVTLSYKIYGIGASTIRQTNDNGMFCEFTLHSSIEINNMTLSDSRSQATGIGMFRMILATTNTIILNNCVINCVQCPFITNTGVANIRFTECTINKTGATNTSCGVLLRANCVFHAVRCKFTGTSISTSGLAIEGGGLIQAGAGTMVIDDCRFIDAGAYGTIAMESGITAIFAGINIIKSTSTAPSLYKTSAAGAGNLDLPISGTIYTNIAVSLQDSGSGDALTYQGGTLIQDANITYLN